MNCPLLIADNSALHRIALQSVLLEENPDLEIILVDTEPSLVDLSKDHQDLIIIVDIGLYGLMGMTGIEGISQNFPGRRICVLVPSATRFIISSALSSGATAVVQKDAAVSDLYPAVLSLKDDRPFFSRMSLRDEPEETGVSHLTPQQFKVMEMLCEGQSNKQIARELDIAPGTVKVHVNAAYKALGVHNRVQACIAMDNLRITQASPIFPS